MRSTAAPTIAAIPDPPGAHLMKKIAKYALIVALIYWLVTDPASGAHVVHSITGLLSRMGSSLSTLASGL
jgi:hypothetical protein